MCGCEPCKCLKVRQAAPASTTPVVFGQLPANPKPAKEAVEPLTGVVESLVTPGRTVINGVEVTQAEAREAVRSGARLPDRSGKLWLVVIGSEADRKAVLADLDKSPALAPWKGRLLVQDYAPDEWAVQVGQKTGGKPTIYIQAQDRKVKHRQDEYVGGAEALAGALRKTDPTYDPNKDPDLRKAEPTPLPLPAPSPNSPSPMVMPTWAMLLLIGGGLYLLFRWKPELGGSR